MPIGNTLARLGISDGEFRELLQALGPRIPYRWVGRQLIFDQDVEFKGRVSRIVGPVPMSISGLDGWWSADAITGKVDGDPIATWADLSGLGHDLTQATGANQPLYKTGIRNGLPVLRFDGSNDSLAGATTPGNAKTVFCVAIKRSGVGGSDKHLWQLAAYARINCINSVDATRWYIVQNQAGSGVVIVGDTVLSWHILALNYASTSSITPWVDGVAGSAFDPNDTYGDSSTLTIADNPAAHSYGDIDVAEVIVYSKSLDPAEMGIIFDYLKNKYAI